MHKGNVLLGILAQAYATYRAVNRGVADAMSFCAEHMPSISWDEWVCDTYIDHFKVVLVV